MPGYGFFQPSIRGMDAQSHALAVIGTNIANVTTGGYKRTDTGFATMISASMANSSAAPESASPLLGPSDSGGVRAQDHARVSEAGDYVTTGRALDVAIGGNGFFVMSANADGSGTPIYGRDGSFATAPGGAATTDAAAGEEAYLVDKNGYYVQGWAADETGSVAVGGRPASMRIDAAAFAALSAPTTSAQLALNLPADGAPASSHSYDIGYFDRAGSQHALRLSFTRLSTANSWQVDVAGGAGDTVTMTPAVGAAGTPLTFTTAGELASPKSYQVAVAHAGAVPSTSAFTLDMSGLTQLAGDFTVYDYDRDGYAPGRLESIAFDQNGTVNGLFDNGHSRPLYRLALADFANPDGLDALDGNVYVEGTTSGVATIGSANTAGLGAIVPVTHELSNVDLAEEFTRMIATQSAYNASATAFRTLDEIIQSARDLIA